MQASISGEKPDFVMLPVPSEVLEDAGIDIHGLLQFTAAGQKVIFENVDPVEADLVCGEGCTDCLCDTNREK